MSYILEALKKAEAERQLGEAPSIHAPLPDAPAAGAAPLRKPLLAAMIAMGAVIVGLAVVVWRQAGAPAASAPPVQPVPAVQPQVVAAAPAPVPVAIAPAPVASAVPAPAAAPLPAVPPVPAAQAARETPPAVASRRPDPAARAEAPPVAAAASVPQAEVPPREEPVQALRDLPEPIRRAIPPVAMSGYMYSPNPADRLVLIDKVLRREGDEVAPGLVLERLEAKGAVFAFRGYRYRMPY